MSHAIVSRPEEQRWRLVEVEREAGRPGRHAELERRRRRDGGRRRRFLRKTRRWRGRRRREVDEVPRRREVEVEVDAAERNGLLLQGRAVVVVTVGVVGEVGLGLGAAEGSRGAVVGEGGLHGGVEGAQPHARLLPRVADLRSVPPPRPLPHAPVVRLASSSSSSRATLAATGARRTPQHRIHRTGRCTVSLHGAAGDVWLALLDRSRPSI
ncbi:hypothetical protein D1007_18501 [Hordeum vulgare]|nr:hypothetical protein D1007_18501 [Hordeum vulgare]